MATLSTTCTIHLLGVESVDILYSRTPATSQIPLPPVSSDTL